MTTKHNRSERYRTARKRLGLTQTELGDMLGIHWTTICRREKGRIPVNREAELALEQIKMTLERYGGVK